MSASNGSAAVAGGPGTVVLLLASSTGGVGQHVRSVARGLVAAGRPVLVCGPAATQDQFDFVDGRGRLRLVAVLARPAAPLVVTWHNAVLAGGVRGAVSRLVERIVARGARVTLGASADPARPGRRVRNCLRRVVAGPAVRAEFAVAADQRR